MADMAIRLAKQRGAAPPASWDGFLKGRPLKAKAVARTKAR
jgi:hypothetical protein